MLQIRTTIVACAGLLLLSALSINGCARLPPPELRTVESVDLQRYVGTWYEIARLPMWFQRHCVDAKATYTLLADGRIAVRNECLTKTGETESAIGVATVVDSRSNARLRVVFENWFARLFGPTRQGNYWILYLDKGYHTAIVGTPDRRYLWILSRSPVLDEPTYERLVSLAEDFGYRAQDLIRDQRSS